MAISKKIIAYREQTIKNFGLVLNEQTQIYCYMDSCIRVPMDTISKLGNDAWTLALNDIVTAIGDLKQVPPSEGEITELEEVIELKTGIELPDKHKANKAIIEGWKKKCEALKLASLEDKDTYKAIASARSFLRKQRTTGEKLRKSMVEDSVAYQKKVNGTWKEYEAAIEEIEAPLQSQLDKWEEWKNEEKLAKEREEQKALNDRIASLLDGGMTYNPAGYYCIGETISMDIVSIKMLQAEAFDKLLTSVKKEKERLDAIAENERLAEQQRKEAERQEREDFERKQKELAAEQEKQEAERKKFEEEKAALRREKLQMRHDKLINIGLLYIKMLAEYQYGNICLSFEKMEAMSNEEFIEALQTYSDTIREAIATEEKEKKEAGELKEKQDREAKEVAEKEQEEKNQREAKEAQEFSLKSHDLINLGMTIMQTSFGGIFIIKNEFENRVQVIVDEIKAISMAEWPGKLQTISEAVHALNEATEAKRAEIKAAKEAALPEIDRLRNHIGVISEAWNKAGKIDLKTNSIVDILNHFEQEMGELIHTTIASIDQLQERINKI